MFLRCWLKSYRRFRFLKTSGGRTVLSVLFAQGCRLSSHCCASSNVLRQLSCDWGARNMAVPLVICMKGKQSAATRFFVVRGCVGCKNSWKTLCTVWRKSFVAKKCIWMGTKARGRTHKCQPQRRNRPLVHVQWQHRACANWFCRINEWQCMTRRIIYESAKVLPSMQ